MSFNFGTSAFLGNSKKCYNRGGPFKKHLLVLVVFVVGLCPVKSAKLIAPGNSHRNVHLITKNGKYLTIQNNGLVVGNDIYTAGADLQINSTGLNGEITIKGIANGMFVTIGSDGKINGSSTLTTRSIFIDVLGGGGSTWRVLKSNLNPTQYLTITLDDVVKTTTNCHSGDAQFAMLSD